jgi:16S rRNA G966 N2-methylase RsmD
MTKQSTVFDYSILETTVQSKISNSTLEIKNLLHRTISDIWTIGQKLCEIKQLLPHGRFGDWLREEFDWDERTAQRFMNVTTHFQQDNLTVLNSGATVLYLLAAPSTPPAARLEALARAEAGEKITPVLAKEIITAHKPEATSPLIAPLAEALEQSYAREKEFEQRRLAKLDGATQKELANKLTSNQANTPRQALNLIRREQAAQKEQEVLAKWQGQRLWQLTSNQQVISCDHLLVDPPYGVLEVEWDKVELESFTKRWATAWRESRAANIAVFWSEKYLWEGREWFDACLHGYAFKQLLIWHYPNTMKPDNRGGFRHSFDPIFLYQREDTSSFATTSNWKEGITRNDVHTGAIPQTNYSEVDCKIHPAQKPLSVYQWLISILTKPGELIVDPFAGSGTCGVAAVQLNRRYYGIEIDPTYLHLAESRIVTYSKADTEAA